MKLKKIFSTAFALMIIGSLAYVGYLFFEDMEGPIVSISPDTGRISPQRPITVHMSDPSKVRSIEVILHYAEHSVPFFSNHFDVYKETDSIDISFRNAPLPEGEFSLEIKVKDASMASFGLGNTTSLLIPSYFDTKNPTISMTHGAPTVFRGGSAVIRYTANEELFNSGIYVEDDFFQGFKQEDGSYVCFFAFPYNLTTSEFDPQFVVEDLAGNSVTTDLAIHAANRVFKEDVINVSDEFLLKVSERLYDLAPYAANPLERFLTINSDVRFSNAHFLSVLGEKSAAHAYWSGKFERLPRSAERAGFGDHRTYMYHGEVLDNQWHLGYDLASVREAEIPAANAGEIVFAGNLGIYGKLVVIDHGFGLMSLYSHLTDILAEVGDIVEKGQTIGTTGETGMAFGDHVHFGILVGGIEVTPLEWLDSNWVRNNITTRMAE